MSPPAPGRSVPWWLPALAVVAVALAVAVPGARFMRQLLRVHRHPPVSEVKVNLKSIYVAERSYLMEYDVYTDDLARVGFAPGAGTRYTYFSAPQGRVLPDMEREHPSAPFQVAPADPRRPTYRGGFTTFAETGCPLTPAMLPDGGTAGLGVTPAEGAREPIFIGAAATNLDADATVDCWSIATEDRRAADGTSIPKGQPYNEQDDMVR